jgi:hypothetical protein
MAPRPRKRVDLTDLVVEARQALGVERGMSEPASLREMARDLSARLAPRPGVSYAAVTQWEAGVAEPAYWFLEGLALHTGGYARVMAVKMLARLHPELWEEVAGKIERGDAAVVLPEIESIIREWQGSLRFIAFQAEVIDGVPSGKFSYATLENVLRDIGERARASIDKVAWR